MIGEQHRHHRSGDARGKIQDPQALQYSAHFLTLSDSIDVPSPAWLPARVDIG
jgi:hypothetical protein